MFRYPLPLTQANRCGLFPGGSVSMRSRQPSRTTARITQQPPQLLMPAVLTVRSSSKGMGGLGPRRITSGNMGVTAGSSKKAGSEPASDRSKSPAATPPASSNARASRSTTAKKGLSFLQARMHPATVTAVLNT